MRTGTTATTQGPSHPTGPSAGISGHRRTRNVLGLLMSMVTSRYAYLSSGDRQPPHGLVPQAAAPVPVLLSTRQQQQWRHDQSASELAISSADNPQLASGSAYNEIEPDTSRLWRPIGISTYVKDVVKASNVEPSGAPPWGGGVGALERIPEDELRRLLSRERPRPRRRGHDRVATLIDLLTDLGPNNEELEALNVILREQGAGIVIKSDHETEGSA